MRQATRKTRIHSSLSARTRLKAVCATETAKLIKRWKPCRAELAAVGPCSVYCVFPQRIHPPPPQENMWTFLATHSWLPTHWLTESLARCLYRGYHFPHYRWHSPKSWTLTHHSVFNISNGSAPLEIFTVSHWRWVIWLHKPTTWTSQNLVSSCSTEVNILVREKGSKL